MLDERPLMFGSGDADLLGILSQPEQYATVGVLIIVGGPQYRVGSHRQFTLLARALADAGYASLRFDHRGMGDSTGPETGFLQLDQDVQAAIDALMSAVTSLKKVVLWGLCDAASASLLYLRRQQDHRVAGLVLLNPWVRSDKTLAETRIRYYYGQRLLQGAFWKKLLSGQFSFRYALAGLLTTLRAKKGGHAGSADSYQQEMREAWCAFPGKTLVILSGLDYTAREFQLWWNEFRLQMPRLESVSLVEYPDANHTFSSRAHRRLVEQATIAWLETRMCSA